MSKRKTGKDLRDSRPEKPDAISASSQAYRRLDALIDSAEAGVSVEHLALAAATTKSLVKAWLKERGIQAKAQPSLVPALDLFGTGGFPARHLVEAKRGTPPFVPPHFLLRRPIQYAGFCAAVQQLAAAGWELRELAEALGFSEADLRNALDFEP